jgi:hypothetical protein
MRDVIDARGVVERRVGLRRYRPEQPHEQGM